MVPVLETARLRLRGHVAADCDAHVAMLGAGEVVRYLGGEPVPREEAWRKLLSGHGAWGVLGYGYWAVERKVDGAYIGLVGFADFKRDITPLIENIPEMGWILAPEAHGQGYASEAIAAGLAWADSAFPATSFVAIIDPDNEASIRTGAKAGFTDREIGSYKGAPILIVRRPAQS